MDDFGSRILQNSSHDIDGGVMTVKKRGGGNDLDGMCWFIDQGVHTYSFSFLKYPPQDKIRLNGDVFLNGEIFLHMPAPEGPHLSQNGNIMAHQIHYLAVQD